MIPKNIIKDGQRTFELGTVPVQTAMLRTAAFLFAIDESDSYRHREEAPGDGAACCLH